MRVGKFLFRPGLLPSLVTLFLLGILLSLGRWQLDRAQQKQALQQRFASTLQQPSMALTRIDDPSDPQNYFRRMFAEGRYDTDHQFLLDNKVNQGKRGYHVLTPLLLTHQNLAILVNRGWLGVAEYGLPDTSVTTVPLTAHGRLGQPANPAIVLGDDIAGWPRQVQYLDYQRASDALGYPLLPAVILLDPEQPHGYHRDWQPHFGGVGPERHHGYAVQWFALAITLIIIYGVVNTRRLPVEEVA